MQNDNIYVRIPSSWKAELRKIAKEEGRTLSNLILFLIRQFLQDRGAAL